MKGCSSSWRPRAWGWRQSRSTVPRSSRAAATSTPSGKTTHTSSPPIRPQLLSMLAIISYFLPYFLFPLHNGSPKELNFHNPLAALFSPTTTVATCAPTGQKTIAFCLRWPVLLCTQCSGGACPQPGESM